MYERDEYCIYSDSIIKRILGRSIPAIKEAFSNLERAAEEVGLKINKDKIKLLQIRKQRTRLRQNIDNYNYFEVVKEF